MAKAKGNRAPEATAKGKIGRVSIVHLLSTTDLEKRWLDEAHRATHIPRTQIVRLALQAWGEARGLPAYPGLGGE